MPTPQSNATESEAVTPAGQNVGNLADGADVAQDEDPNAAAAYDYGSSYNTTPAFAGQTEAAVMVEYTPTRAVGQERNDRKKGKFKRTRAECGNDETPEAYKNNPNWRYDKEEDDGEGSGLGA